MKKLLIVLMVVAMASFLFVGCNGVTPDIPVAVTGVTLDKATLALVAGGATGTLVKTVAPADATDPRVTWASSAEAVATVALGVVTPLTAGTAVITVTTVDGGFNDTCIVTVSAAPAEPVAVTGVTLDEATLALTVGDAAVTLVATVAPATAADTSVIWASSDETVAIVAAGVVTPLNAGISAITVTTVDGGFVATCVVTVTAASEPLPVSTTPVIAEISGIDLYSSDTQYINEDEADDGIFVEGFAPRYSEIKIYIDGEVVSTGYAYGLIEEFKVFITGTKLGDDGEKVLCATATELGLVESAPSTEYTFILDTVAPEIVEVAASKGDETVTVTFDEALDEDTAEDRRDWTVEDVTVTTDTYTGFWPSYGIADAELTDDEVVELGVDYTANTVVGDVILVTYDRSGSPIRDLAGNPAVESDEWCILF